MDVAAIDDGFFDYLAFTRGLDGAEIRKLYDRGGPQRILDLTLRTGPFGDRYGEHPGGLTLDLLKVTPNGIDFGPMVPQLPDILGTPDKKIRLAPPYLLDDLPRLAARVERPAEPLVLVNRRHLRSNNSWLHNVPALMKGKERCTLLIHPDDAAQRALPTTMSSRSSLKPARFRFPWRSPTQSSQVWCPCRTAGAMANRAPAWRWLTVRPASIPTCSLRRR